MSDYVVSRVEKQKHFKIAPLKSGRGKRKRYVIGFDSEADTRTGRPMLLQFSRPEHADETATDLIVVPENKSHAAIGLFMAYVQRYCTRRDTEYLIYGWNIAYEFTQLFHDIGDEAKRTGEWEMLVRSRKDGKAKYRIRVFNDKRYMMTITNLTAKTQVRVLDGMSFFKTSLDNAAKMLNLGAKFAGVDRRLFTRDDLTNQDFLRYAAMDAYITRRVGEYILSMHEDYDVTTCISAPHFASKVFKRRFLGQRIELPNTRLEQAGLWSYHGGKNGFYLTDPSEIVGCYQYDITSAYPEAMRQLPNPELAEWRPIRSYKPGRHGIYRVTLEYRRCKYRGMMTYDGLWPESGYYEDVHLTSYELDAMVERDEVRVIKINGWQMIGPAGGPLVEYVDTFFRMKSTSIGPLRETAKLLLNSLYGKFFQKVALGRVGWLKIDIADPDNDAEWIATDPTQEYDWRAGGLYHPPIASLITGYVRAKIHRLEHKYESLMTSTDGIFGMIAPDATDLGNQLGGLTVQRGTLRIWRERLYVFRPDDDGKPKWAAHGFRAGMDELERLPLAHGEYEYTGRQMVTLRLSTIGLNGERYEPGRFVDLPYRIVI